MSIYAIICTSIYAFICGPMPTSIYASSARSFAHRLRITYTSLTHSCSNHLRKFIYIHLRTQVRIRLHARLSIHLHIHLRIPLQLRLYVLLRIGLVIPLHVHLRTHVHIHVHLHLRTHVHIYLHIYFHIYPARTLSVAHKRYTNGRQRRYWGLKSELSTHKKRIKDIP